MELDKTELIQIRDALQIFLITGNNKKERREKYKEIENNPLYKKICNAIESFNKLNYQEYADMIYEQASERHPLDLEE